MRKGTTNPMKIYNRYTNIKEVLNLINQKQKRNRRKKISNIKKMIER